jgi:hypothetical protein
MDDTCTEKPVIDIDVAIPSPILSQHANPSLYLRYKNLKSADGHWGFKVSRSEETPPYPMNLGWPTDIQFDQRLREWKIEELFGLEKCRKQKDYTSLRVDMANKFVDISRFVVSYREKYNVKKID